MNNHKPTKEQIDRFNGLYEDVIVIKKQIDSKLKALLKDAKTVDKLAEKAFKYANGKDGMYYNDDNGIIKCVSKSIRDRVETLCFLREYSSDIVNN